MSMTMRVLGKTLGALLLLLLLFTAPSTADIISSKIKSHNRDIILFSEFEFSHSGCVSVAVSSVGISSNPVTSYLPQPDPARIGFFLIPHTLSDRYDLQLKRNPNLCPFDVKSITLLFTFSDLSATPHSSFIKSHNVTNSGKYSLYFANCNALSLVMMDVRTELYNIDDDGTTRDYLSAGQPQPSVYFKFSLIYLCLIGFWISISFNRDRCLLRIHLLMGALLVMTILHLLCGMEDQQDLKATGTYHGWHTLVYITQCMRNALFFAVLLLIGHGWCFWKPVLTECNRFIMTMLILLQVWAIVICMKVRESGPYNNHWEDLISNFRLIDIICCVVVFLSTLFMAADTEDKEAMLSYRAATGRRPEFFGVQVFIYVYYSRGWNIPLEITTPLEIGNLVFIMIMFYMYRPFLVEDEVLCSGKGFLDDTLV